MLAAQTAVKHDASTKRYTTQILAAAQIIYYLTLKFKCPRLKASALKRIIQKCRNIAQHIPV